MLCGQETKEEENGRDFRATPVQFGMRMIKHKVRPRPTITWTICSILILFAQSNGKTDTTFGETRLVPKEHKENDAYKGQEADSKRLRYDENDDEEECGFFSCILGNAIEAMFRFMIIGPFRSFFTDRAGVYDFHLKPSRGAIGMSFLNFAYTHPVSFSYAFRLDGDFIVSVSDHLFLRENIGIEFSPGGALLSDFERNVYVNKALIGTQRDIGDHYYRHTMPILTEVAWRPKGENGSGYIVMGGGPSFVYERLYGNREYSYLVSTDSVSTNDWYWAPCISMGFGKLMQTGSLYGAFEIRYNLTINGNDKQRSLPGSTSRFTHGVTALEYKLIF